ncbi:peptidoglycan-binding protein [Dermabacter vaginalis]|uniref:CHAP domain-containing protein n=1 Tax=Dermabacter vaginalis TaxID=1630135 RepID=A0ABX6A395_9MICO|nr:peptidoglycan-binding protein [Dermabacter vaginalis]QEU11659.1 CHAP domain-containing protein [Dermabacter vaginalis]
MSARKVLAIAAGEVGYSRWSDPKRGTKYARETQPVLWPNEKWLLASGVSYCDIFVTWVFWKAGCLNILPGKQSYNVNYRASHGGHVSKSQAQPGDVLVFDWDMSTKRANHVGILEKRLSSGNFQTIEGNTTTGTRGSQSNGGRVARRVRRPSQVRYVIRPNWKAAPATGGGKGTAKPVTVSKAPAFPLPAGYYYGPPSGPRQSVSGRTRNSRVPGDVIQVNGRWRSKGLAVWQARMQARGWNIGKDGADGRYGNDTERVVRRFQKNKNLGVDGKIGPKTWRAAFELPVT